jgi:hypothetical protein
MRYWILIFLLLTPAGILQAQAGDAVETLKAESNVKTNQPEKGASTEKTINEKIEEVSNRDREKSADSKKGDVKPDEKDKNEPAEERENLKEKKEESTGDKREKEKKAEEKETMENTVTAEDELRQGKPLKVGWEAVQYAKGYLVQIRNLEGKTVLERKTDSNELTFFVPPGEYELRVGAVSIFDRVESWSEWKKFRVLKRKTYTPPSIGWYISPVFTQRFYVGDVGQKVTSTYPGLTLDIGIFGTEGFWRWTALEFELFYHRLEGSAYQSAFNALGGGVNILFVSRFAFPLNVVVRAGGGVTESRYEYYSLLASAKKAYWSTDYYFQFGVAMDYSFYRDYYLQLGLDYQLGFYKNNMAHSMILRLAAGYRAGWGTNYSWKGESREFTSEEEKAPRVGFKVMAGYPVAHMVGDWSDTFKASFLGGMVNLGVYGKYRVLKWFGLELEAGYHNFQGKSGQPNMHTTMGGLAIRGSTPFDFPVNAVLRAGGGIMFTNFSSTATIPGSTTKYWSFDTYYRFGLGAEIRLLGPWYLEAGMDYLFLNYWGDGMHALRYYLMTGVKL